MPGGSADPFVALLEWLVGDAHGGDGSIEELAKRCAVRVRTLRDWAAGSYPTERNSRQVQRLHVWAVGSVRGYPPPDGSGPSLVQLSGPERRLSESPTLGAASAGTTTDPPRRSPVGDTTDAPLQPELALAGGRRRSNGYLVVGLALVVAAAVVGLGAHAHWWRSSAPAPVASGTSSNGATRRTPVPAGLTVLEYADNKDGTPVYATPTGQSVGSLAPARIPFRTPVRVRCQVPDQTGIASVHALYLIASGPWQGLFGVADTFTNGDRLGASGGHNVDARVPDCP